MFWVHVVDACNEWLRVMELRWRWGSVCVKVGSVRMEGGGVGKTSEDPRRPFESARDHRPIASRVVS